MIYDTWHLTALQVGNVAKESCRIVETVLYRHGIVVYGALETPVDGRIAWVVTIERDLTTVMNGWMQWNHLGLVDFLFICFITVTVSLATLLVQALLHEVEMEQRLLASHYPTQVETVVLYCRGSE